ncbi:MAG: flavin reductase [Chitinophagales bacterium]
MRRPWNIINSPVYSLATYDQDQVNMNICTYVTAISMTPKLYAIAVYHNTKTHQTLAHSKSAVLQLLHKNHTSVIRILGKKSGLKYNKQQYLSKKNLLTHWKNNLVLKEACAYLSLTKVDQIDVKGDHDLFYFKVDAFQTLNDQHILMFQDLIDAKIIL